MNDDATLPLVLSDPSGPDDVGSAAIGAALGDLDRAIRRDRCHAVVVAPPGSGSALLLRALAERLEGILPVVHVRPPRGDEEICEQVLRALGRDPHPDPELRLLSVVQELGSRGAGLVLLVEDAEELSAPVLRRLGRLAALSRPDLRLALAVTARSGSGDELIRWVVGALGVSAEKIVLDSQMQPAEPAAPSAAPVDLRVAVGERVREERAIQAMHLELRSSGSGALRWAAAVSLAVAVALIGADHISIQPLPGVEPLLPAAASEEVLPELAAHAAAEEVLPELAAHAAAEEVLPGAAAHAAAEEALPELVAHAAAEGALPEPGAPAPVSAGTPQALAPGDQAKAQPQVARPKPLATIEAPATLAPTLTTVPVSMNAKPWARIEVDGREVGVTPLADVPMAIGHHRFRAHLPDGSVVEREARVDAQRDHVVFP